MLRSLLVWSGRGGWFNYRLIGDLNQPPRLRELRWLRKIFLIAQPPLLSQGGEFRRIVDFMCKAPANLGGEFCLMRLGRCTTKLDEALNCSFRIRRARGRR